MIGNAIDFLVFSTLLLSFECVAMAYVSCIIQQVPWNATIAVISFLVAFSVYNMNRKTDENEDSVNHKDRYTFTKRYETHLFYGALLALALALVIAGLHGIPALLVTAAPFACGLLYSFRLLPERFGYQRLKEIPAVKNMTVGFAWGILLSLLPICLSHGVPDSRTAVVFLLFFMWGFMASLIPDVRDRIGDAGAGVRTIPVLYGQEQTKKILFGVLLLMGIPAILFSTLFLSRYTTALIVAVNLYSHGCASLLDRAQILNVLADVISDGQYIFFAIGIILVAPLQLGV